MIKHRYDYRTAKTDHRWSVYFTTKNNEDHVPGQEKFYDDHEGGFYVSYFGPVEVNEFIHDNGRVFYEEVNK